MDTPPRRLTPAEIDVIVRQHVDSARLRVAQMNEQIAAKIVEAKLVQPSEEAQKLKNLAERTRLVLQHGNERFDLLQKQQVALSQLDAVHAAAQAAVAKISMPGKQRKRRG